MADGDTTLRPSSKYTQRKSVTSLPLKAAGVMGAVTERLLIALTATAETERFFFGNNAAVRQRDFSLGTLYLGGSIGNDYNF